MRGFGRLTLVNLKLYVREPIATFFTLVFPPLLVVLFGAMYGNEPTPMFGGYGTMTSRCRPIRASSWARLDS